jgi:hypothetical protein
MTTNAPRKPKDNIKPPPAPPPPPPARMRKEIVHLYNNHPVFNRMAQGLATALLGGHIDPSQLSALINCSLSIYTEQLKEKIERDYYKGFGTTKTPLPE